MTPVELEQSSQVTLLHGESRVRLLAVRFAGAPFEPPFNLRSRSFDDLLAERCQRRHLLAELREWLIEALFRSVPTVAERGTRHRLLETKRRIFNGLQLESTDLPLAPDLLAALARYRELMVQEEDACCGARSEAILAEIRQQLQAVWAGPRFRLACRHASPDLVEDLEKEGLPVAGELTSIERGCYAFVSRWTSKANPFHLFAEVAFPPASGIAVDGDHEIVLDAAALLAIERRLLPRVDDPQRIHLVLRPFQRLDGKLVLWIPAQPGFRLVARPSGDPVLQATIGFFAEQRRRLGRPTGTLAEWLAAGGGTRESLAELCREGILEQYLIPDLDRFGEPLRGIDPDLDPELERMATLHLARVSTAALESVSAAIQVRSYVNSYRRLESESFEEAAEEVGPTLRALKPCFEKHNFSSYDYVIRSYLLDYLAHAGRDQVPYLEILRHFLRHRQEIIPRYQPEVHRSQAERDRRRREADRLRCLTGRLETAALQALELPGTGGLRNLCFNGPFDFVERVFYVSNVFAGDGRFAGRYLLHRRRAEVSRCDDGDLHVELAVPPEPNLNYVVRRFPVGCGFEARYAHKYERWLDPSEILVARDGAGFVYRDAASGRRLRLHYSGFQLAPLLPAEYQLLLVGHADSFHNPFLRKPDVGYDPGLQVGPVCLRRESWVVGQDFWGDLPRERSSIRFAARLRELVQDRLALADLWYYLRLQGVPGHRKPRFLDLRSPLSAYAFQREIAAPSPGATVSLSPMRPAPSHLHHRDGSPVVTELMIEI